MKSPNIIYFHIDNLDQGELGCNGGGMLRGVDTRRIDQFASQGMRLTHFVVEATWTRPQPSLQFLDFGNFSHFIQDSRYELPE
jgi:arylsulfatase